MMMILPWSISSPECLVPLPIRGIQNSQYQTQKLELLFNFFSLSLFVNSRDPNKPSDPQLRNIRWRPFSYKKQHYLDIGDEVTMRGGLNIERYELWKRLFPLNWRRQSKRDSKASKDYE